MDDMLLVNCGGLANSITCKHNNNCDAGRPDVKQYKVLLVSLPHFMIVHMPLQYSITFPGSSP